MLLLERVRQDYIKLLERSDFNPKKGGYVLYIETGQFKKQFCCLC